MIDLELLGESNWRGPGVGRKPPFYKRTWFTALLALGILTGVGTFAVLVFVIQPLKDKAETFDLADVRKLESASIIYDRNGGELGRLYVMNRTPIKLDEVPQHFIKALTAQEDSRYFEHDGVDYLGIGRAVALAVQMGKVTQGASTITQQLARQTFELREKSIQRKILEAFVAQRIEKQYTKKEILELYLNRIFFGSGNGQNFYGIQAAARGYFGKDVRDLNLEESATIAGLIKAPNLYTPLKHPEAAIRARNQVFDRMLAEGYITEDEHAQLGRKPMITAGQTIDARLTYVYDEVRRQVMQIVGEEKAATGGFNIYTSIDPIIQKAADQAVQQRLAEVEGRPGYEHETYAQYRGVLSDYRKKLASREISPDAPKPRALYLQGSALVIDNADGAVLALVGGRDYRDSQLNRAFYSSRQVGTAFTPLVYAAAYQSPMFFPGTPVLDQHFDNTMIMIGGFTGILGEWGEEVANPKYKMGNISLREALVRSRNAATVRLAYQAFPGPSQRDPLDLAPIKDIAKKAGINSPIQDLPASVLGQSEAKLDEMCLAYSCFPNKGTRAKRVHLINRIKDAQDKTIYQISEEDVAPVEAMDELAAWQVNSSLTDALNQGTAAVARTDFGLKNFPAAGKTGTHLGFKDLWFLGYSSRVTCGVWVGFDKPKTIYPSAFSSRIALPIWSDIMNASTTGFKPEPFAPPATAEKIEICKKSGLRATDFCFEKHTDAKGKVTSVRDTFTEFARPGTAFDSYCTVHAGEGLALDLQSFSSPIGKPDGASIALANAGKFANIEPVRMQGLTILGDDPYNTVKPILRATPASNVEGTNVKRAILVDEEGNSTTQLPVKLEPPKGLRLDP